nr:response regulator [Gammaproteobacteria bacterium]
VIASECSVTANFIKESLHKLVNIFNMLAVPAVVNIINNYLDKIKSLEQISPSLKQNTSVFVKYLKEIAKSLYNNRGFAFYLKAAKKLIDSLPFAAIENILEDKIISDEQPKQLQLSDKNKTDDLTEIFFDEANDILENLYQLLDNLSVNPADPELINSFSRELHTLKGAGRMVGFTLISDWAHHLEELVAQYSAKVHLCSKQHVEVLHTGARHISNLLTAYQEKSIPELPKLLKLNFSETDFKSDSKFEDNISQISIATLLKNPPVEKLIQDSKKALPTRQTVRIANDELDSLLDGVCELIIGQHQLAGQINYYKVLADKLKNFTKPSELEFQVIVNNLIELNKSHASLIKNNENNIASVFEKLINLRMVPLNAIRSRLENLVDSIASELHKKIHLNLGKLEGNIDRVVLEQITPILDHMIRNAVDHGIENENSRRKFNKNIIGTINLSIYVENNAVLIEISDDGSGIDIEKVLKKAKELKLISTDHTAQTLSNDELISILTISGFSTKDKGNLTQISGRGIGMDVVKSIVNQLCGVINVETKKHHGSKFTIKIPYSLTKQPLLFIKVCDLIYAIPILIIDETIKINKTELLVNKNDTAVYKDIQVYDMFDLINMDKKDYYACFSEFNQKSEYYNLLVVKYNGSKLGFIVEEFFEIEEAVVRPLPAQMRESNEYMGGTIYKDDQVVLILDLIAILNSYRSKTGVLETGIATATGTDLAQKHKNYNILVLEDSATMRHAIEQYLSGPEYNIIMAVDGADGLKKIKLFNPDLILLDIIMPNMNGLEFLKYIRQQEQFKTTPVIIMTSRDDESYRKIAMQLNVDIYLKKPYDKPKLVNAIEHVLSE